MFSIIKIALIGSCLLGTAGNQALQSQVMHQAGPAAQLTGNINVDEYIGEDKALEIALKDAGVKEKDTSYSLVHLDTEDGRIIYDVEFMVGNEEYDYDIDAKTGDIFLKTLILKETMPQPQIREPLQKMMRSKLH
ncbi:MAG: PepSY domain-containing protein [Faecalicoccus sp.]|nr:PepSY domain-containing protein [Faecalicoccus sp.]